MRTLRDGAQGVCWLCESYPRTRAIKIVLEKFLAKADGQIKMLHIAPESSLRDWLKNYEGLDYIAVDKRTQGYEYPEYVMDMDIQSI